MKYSAPPFTAISFHCLTLVGLFLLSVSSDAFAQQQIRVSQIAWNTLTTSEQILIQQRYLVSLFESHSFGVIIDNQGINESTPGTSGGSALGGAIGNAAYIDNALKTGNYSAKTQLASGILGAMIGSSFDSKPNAQFHFRYAVKLGNGDVQYFDQVKADAFRHPVGVCVSVPNLLLIDQQLCTQNAAMLRATYLQGATSDAASINTPIQPPSTNIVISPSANVEQKGTMSIQIGDTVRVSNGSINGYQAPSISAKRLREYSNGASFEVIVMTKDFFKVRDAKDQLAWVERRGVAASLPSITPSVQSKTSPPLQLQDEKKTNTTGDSSPVLVNCKFGTLAPVRTSAEKCKLINGSEVE